MPSEQLKQMRKEQQELREAFQKDTKGQIEELWQWMDWHAWGAEQTRKRTDELFQVTTYVMEGMTSLEEIWQQEVEADDGSGYKTVKQLAPKAIMTDMCKHLGISQEQVDRKAPWANEEDLWDQDKRKTHAALRMLQKGLTVDAIKNIHCQDTYKDGVKGRQKEVFKLFLVPSLEANSVRSAVFVLENATRWHSGLAVQGDVRITPPDQPLPQKRVIYPKPPEAQRQAKWARKDKKDGGRKEEGSGQAEEAAETAQGEGGSGRAEKGNRGGSSGDKGKGAAPKGEKSKGGKDKGGKKGGKGGKGGKGKGGKKGAKGKGKK